MLYFIFSFNRGQFLENCVRSIEKCAPHAKITVYDDGSTDPITLSTLDKISRKHGVWVNQEPKQHKHGGLYSNMQKALESIKGDQVFCFLQDDTQLVRAIDKEDDFYIRRYFESDPRAGFLTPTFMKGSSRERDLEGAVYERERNVYLRDVKDQHERIHYSDIFISMSGRLRDNGWKFLDGEPKNNQQARKLFNQKAMMFVPFVMWLPYAVAYRGGRKTIALQMSERMRRCGFYPYRYMTVAEVREMRQRDPSELPVAEDFLYPLTDDLRKPWIYHPLQGSRLLRHLNRLELALRR